MKEKGTMQKTTVVKKTKVTRRRTTSSQEEPDYHYEEDYWEKTPKTDYTYSRSKSYTHTGTPVVSPNMARQRIRGYVEMAGGGYSELDELYRRSEYLTGTGSSGGSEMSEVQRTPAPAQISTSHHSTQTSSSSSSNLIAPGRKMSASLTRSGTPYNVRWSLLAQKRASQGKLLPPFKDSRNYEQSESQYTSMRGYKDYEKRQEYSGEPTVYKEGSLNYLYGLDDTDAEFSDTESSADSRRRRQTKQTDTTITTIITTTITTVVTTLLTVITWPVTKTWETVSAPFTATNEATRRGKRRRRQSGEMSIWQRLFSFIVALAYWTLYPAAWLLTSLWKAISWLCQELYTNAPAAASTVGSAIAYVATAPFTWLSHRFSSAEETAEVSKSTKKTVKVSKYSKGIVEVSSESLTVWQRISRAVSTVFYRFTYPIVYMASGLWTGTSAVVQQTGSALWAAGCTVGSGVAYGVSAPVYWLSQTLFSKEESTVTRAQGGFLQNFWATMSDGLYWFYKSVIGLGSALVWLVLSLFWSIWSSLVWLVLGLWHLVTSPFVALAHLLQVSRDTVDASSTTSVVSRLWQWVTSPAVVLVGWMASLWTTGNTSTATSTTTTRTTRRITRYSSKKIVHVEENLEEPVSWASWLCGWITSPFYWLAWLSWNWVFSPILTGLSWLWGVITSPAVAIATWTRSSTTSTASTESYESMQSSEESVSWTSWLLSLVVSPFYWLAWLLWDWVLSPVFTGLSWLWAAVTSPAAAMANWMRGSVTSASTESYKNVHISQESMSWTSWLWGWVTSPFYWLGMLLWHWILIPVLSGLAWLWAVVTYPAVVVLKWMTNSMTSKATTGAQKGSVLSTLFWGFWYCLCILLTLPIATIAQLSFMLGTLGGAAIWLLSGIGSALYSLWWAVGSRAHRLVSYVVLADVWLLARTSAVRRRRGCCCLLPLLFLIPLLFAGSYYLYEKEGARGVTLVGLGDSVNSGFAAFGSSMRGGMAGLGSSAGSGIIGLCSSVGSSIIWLGSSVGSGIATVGSSMGSGLAGLGSSAGSGLVGLGSSAGSGIIWLGSSVGTGLAALASSAVYPLALLWTGLTNSTSSSTSTKVPVAVITDNEPVRTAPSVVAVDGVSKSEHQALYDKVQQILVLLDRQKESGQQLQAGMLTKTDVEVIVKSLLDKEMAGFAAAAGSDREVDLAAQAKLKAESEAKLKDLAAQLLIIQGKSEELSQQLVSAKENLHKEDARVQTEGQQNIIRLEEQLAALQANVGKIQAAQDALLLAMKDCCKNDTALALLVQNGISDYMAGLMMGGGAAAVGGSGGGGAAAMGFREWLRGQFVNKDDMDAQLNAVAAKLTKEMNIQLAEAAKSAKLSAVAAATDTVKAEMEASGGGAAGGGTASTADAASAAFLLMQNGSAITEEKVRMWIRQALYVFDADKTGKVDYALESAGGSVLSTRCSETFHRRTAQLSLFGIPLWYANNSPRTVIQPDVHPGQCWAFKGSQGYIVLQLAGTVKPEAFSLEHIPKSLSPTGKIDSAPKDFSVIGLKSDRDTDGYVMGNYTYDQDGEPLQYFAVRDPDVPAFPVVELQIHNNHGNIEYTCLYRFRVHGKLQKN